MDTSSTLSTKSILISVCALAILVAVFFGVRRLWKQPSQPNIDVGRSIAEDFLAAVRTNPGKAWDSTTAEFKSIEGRESFVRKVKATPILTDKFQFNSSQQVLIKQEPRTEYLFQTSKAKLVRVLVGFESGNWKVDRLTL